MAIDLIIFVGTFAAIFANIWRHTMKSDDDRSGILLVTNFLIAILGVLILFWRWGVLADIARAM